MSVMDGVEKAQPQGRKPGGALLVFLPAMIAAIGAVALVLGQLQSGDRVHATGYGIDEVTTGAIAPPR